MKTHLHKLREGFIVTSDEEIKLHDVVLLDNSIKELPDYNGLHLIELLDETLLKAALALKAPKVIAQQDQIDFSVLSEEEQKKIGWFDTRYWLSKLCETDENLFSMVNHFSYQIGFRKAQELLSDRRFTLEHIGEAIQFGKEIRSQKSFLNQNFGSPFIDYEDSTKETNDYIQSLSQQSWEIEIEMEDKIALDGHTVIGKEPKLINGKIKILRIL